MLELAVRIVGIIITTINTVVRVIDILQKAKDKRQKSNRTLDK